MSDSAYEEVRGQRWPITSKSLLTTLALSALISTVLLIMLGSFVRVSGNGLGCPDWPLCYGRAVPPMRISAWVEFGHRLFGGIVSLQIFAVTYLAWAGYRDQRWIWLPATLACTLLVLQIALGGLHVLNELPRWTGLIHTAVAMAITGLLAVIVAVTQPLLRDNGRERPGVIMGSSLSRLSALGAGATYILLLSGSLVTRTGASLACPGFPFCGLSEISEQLRPFTTIQMIHRLAAFAVALLIGLIVWSILRLGIKESVLQKIAIGLAILIAIQFSLGISNVFFALPMWSRVLHLGVGATIWSLSVILAVVVRRARLRVT